MAGAARHLPGWGELERGTVHDDCRNRHLLRLQFESELGHGRLDGDSVGPGLPEGNPNCKIDVKAAEDPVDCDRPRASRALHCLDPL